MSATVPVHNSAVIDVILLGKADTNRQPVTNFCLANVTAGGRVYTGFQRNSVQAIGLQRQRLVQLGVNFIARSDLVQLGQHADLYGVAKEGYLQVVVIFFGGKLFRLLQAAVGEGQAHARAGGRRRGQAQLAGFNGQLEVVEGIAGQCGVDGKDGCAKENNGADDGEGNTHGSKTGPAQLQPIPNGSAGWCGRRYWRRGGHRRAAADSNARLQTSDRALAESSGRPNFARFAQRARDFE